MTTRSEAVSHWMYPVSGGVIVRRSEAEPKDLLSSHEQKQILRFAQDDASMRAAGRLILKPF